MKRKISQLIDKIKEPKVQLNNYLSIFYLSFNYSYFYHDKPTVRPISTHKIYSQINDRILNNWFSNTNNSKPLQQTLGSADLTTYFCSKF